MNKNEYQMGDVTLVNVDRLPQNCSQHNPDQNIVIATDINGEHYTLEDDEVNEAESLISHSTGNSQFVQVLSCARLKHQRYSDVAVPSGIYRVRVNSKYLHSEHGRRVAEYALLLGKALEFDEQHLAELEFASRIHDIGFIGCEEVLWQPKWFSSEDWAVVQGHPARSAKMMEPLKGRYAAATERAQSYVLYHHEHLDGSGYPHGIAGDDIPIGARILLIADAFEAMTSWRPFREPLPEHVALDRLSGDAKYRFDEQLVAMFTDCLNELEISELCT